MYNLSMAYYAYSMTWVDWYRFVAGIIALSCVVGAVFLSIFVFNAKERATRKTNFFYKVVDMNGSKFETVVKALYIAITVYTVLMMPAGYYGGFFIGIYASVWDILQLGLYRVFFEMALLVYRTHLQVTALNKQLGVKTPLVDSIYEPAIVRQPQPVYAAPPAPAQAPTYVAPQAPAQAPAYAAPQAPAQPAYVPPQPPVQQAAPAPAYVAPQPPVQPPVQAAPVQPPVQVAPPAPVVAGPRLCIACGKEIKEGAKFCPYCGTNQ